MLTARSATALLLMTGLFAAFSTPAFADEPIIVRLVPAGPSGSISAIATLIPEGDHVGLTVDAGGLAPNSEIPVLVNAGACSALGASTGVLGLLQTDAGGKGSLTATEMRASATGVPVLLPLTLEGLADGGHSIVIAEQPILACGSIPRVAGGTVSPVQLPRTGDAVPALPAGIAGAAALLAGCLMRRHLARGTARRQQAR